MSRRPAPDDEPTRALDRPTADLRTPSRRGEEGLPSLDEGGVFGPYDLGRRLGRGGMGTVWEAEHRLSGHRLALKVLNTGFATEEDRERFLQEGRLAASVNHPRSVYVYGTEAVRGHPVITMELMPGGTLADVLRASGPCAVHQAVDWTLQVLEGLQAAGQRGILHRDVKPSNCFLDARGEAKVGDYGLAWSTRGFAREPGADVFAGTPAYASPEQVRCEALDARSDLYAVGVTLYQLLTGRLPFEGETLAEVLKAVQEAPPLPPGRLRKDIPPGLEAVILACLEKDRTRRPATYGELRAALKPFSSEAPEPAPLGTRALAFGLDAMPWFFLEALLERFHPARSTTPLDAFLLLLLPGLVFWGTEARFRASPGKRLLGLEVRDEAGDRPGWRAVGIRTAVWMALFKFQMVLALLVGSGWGDRLGPVGDWAVLLAMAALYLPMRPWNGYRGLHELLSGTRVVAVPMEGLAEPETAWPVEPASGARRLGPYLVKEPLRVGAEATLWLAWDPALSRDVWIVEGPEGKPQIPESRRVASRAGSLHWMHGRRGTETWDAYEAVPGQSLADRVTEGADWASCRGWMRDLAEELAIRASEGQPPEVLSGTRVWLGQDGRARFSDFPVPSEADAPVFHEAPAFFAWMASALRRGPWPLHAMDLVAGLEAGRLSDPEALAARLKALQARPARLTWRRRLAHLAMGLALPALLLLVAVTELPIPARRPEAVLLAALALLEKGERGEADPRLAGHAGDLERVALFEYRRLKHGPAESGSLDDRARRIYLEGAAYMAVPRRLEPLDRSLPPLSREDRDRSYAAVAGPLDEVLALSFRRLLNVFGFALSLVGMAGLLSSLAFRGGLGFRMAGLAVVGPDGRAASRLRGLARGAAAWGSWLAALVPLVGDAPGSQAASQAVLRLDFFGDGPAWAALVFLVAGAGYALRHPGRGLQDRLAGTWIVPR